MKCTWVQERLLLYLAEELGAADSVRTADHLEQCKDCSALLNELGNNQDALRGVVRTSVQPPASLDARIMKRIAALPRQRFFGIARIFHGNRQTALALAGFALALLLIGYQLGRWNADHSPLPGTPEVIAAYPMMDLASLANIHRAWDRKAETSDTDNAVTVARLARQTAMPVTLLNLNDSSLKMKDGAILQVNRVPVAMIHYDWNGIPVSLAQVDGMRLAPFLSQHETHDHGRCFLVHQSEELTFVLWCEGKEHFVLVARVPPARLFALACKMCAQIQHG